jgi:membrane fusion protein, multidrug efflux system
VFNVAAEVIAPAPSARDERTTPRLKARWQKYGTPVLVVLLAVAVVVTMTRNWNAWEGGRIEQVTNDAFVRGDVTPLSTKVAGLVREVRVTITR